MNGPPDIEIAICTFQREHVATTLASLARIEPPAGRRVAVIVADNDDTPSARARVEACALPFPLRYIHAPARNISVARNACLEAARAPVLVFIDDDETVAPDWLVTLLAKQAETGAEAVLGPAISVYPETAPGWMRRGDFHSSRATRVGGEIRTGYGCNTLLMREAPALAGLRFRHELGRSGGEDTVFLAEMHRRGGRIAYAPKARVFEVVAPHRARLGWLLRRKFRFGQTHGLLLRETGAGQGVARLRAVALAAAKSALSLVLCGLNFARPVARAKWLLRAVFHAGVVSKLTGGREAEPYGRDQPV
ncbi:glycosyltransferase [Limimaricola pyoseonensis]|uniref:Succinoglycan biosynthesis protein ExoM n=1 Tax=Limimaricola pyoseonensis TaxID=521013 RepID=A0A1G7J116_9RHOB|nr:glycosyltransferase family 2 protein [Limimaricola pyoseonensis]SDF18581.1 succinoglycan biosynthesis protein ExoM [Limimaricola pyoseonensis]